MRKRFKRLVLSLLGIASLAGGQAGAQYCGNCCWDVCSFSGCFEVGGEALWMKATGASWQYAVVTSSTGSDTSRVTTENMKQVVADHDWGFRLFGSYYSDSCCNSMTLDWIYLRTSDANTTREVNQAIYDPEGNASLTTGDIKFDYDRVNLRFTRNLCQWCDSRLYAFAGGRYVHIKEQRASFAQHVGFDFRYKSSSCLQAGGFEVGFGGQHDLWCDFGLIANMGFTTQIGELKDRWRSIANIDGTTTIRTIKPRTICVPGTELRLGVNYLYKCDCWWIKGEVGYQMDYYWRALFERSNLGGNAPNIGSRKSVGFAGLYFGLSARF